MTDAAHPHHEQNIIETLQSLVVAFVLAMAFRGFVLEGFVIPTGSMAPTLMGQHTLWTSPATGSTFRVDANWLMSQRVPPEHTIYDPLSVPRQAIEHSSTQYLRDRSRMGDRILVVKGWYEFRDPQRYDVVVFKNPTDPDGPSENYIKRLVGLPDEVIWLADGDVFVRPRREGETALQPHDSLDGFSIQRKPEHVQRAVWQPVYHSDYVEQPGAGQEVATPWRFDRDEWEIDGRMYRTTTAEPTTLDWDTRLVPLNDWTAYDMLMLRNATAGVNLSDIRVAAAIVPERAGLMTTLDLEARGHLFEFQLDGTSVHLRMRHLEAASDGWIGENSQPFELVPGEVVNVEFWHVDQCMTMFINGDVVAELEYEWSPVERIERTTGRPWERAARQPRPINPPEARLRWHFSGSPVTMHRLRVDRDLYYRQDGVAGMFPAAPGFERLARRGSEGFGTDPDKLAVLRPDHFFMLGDNSIASLDSRRWGPPHPLVARQIDPHPFVVHRKLLLGKAWVVYFPAPYPLRETGVGVIPDFGRLRFIR